MKRLEDIVGQERFSQDDIVAMLAAASPAEVETLRRAAYGRTSGQVGDWVYYRGLIELSNICTASCRYCGIRRLNPNLKRYTLGRSEIVDLSVQAARAGYGSVCLQAGERHDPKFVQFIADCVREIGERTASDALPLGVGITLSLGDQAEEVYAQWADAARNRAALRYLLRFETSNPALFARLHSAPGNAEKRLERRFESLRALRRCGYQVGTGVMIGIPGQTLEDLARDIGQFAALDADMIGMGPYLMSEGGELQALGQMEPGRLLQLSLNMISAVRLVLAGVNIAAATALDALDPRGREKGIAHGCNVIMPNITPARCRAGYQLYDNKPGLADSPLEGDAHIEEAVARSGRRVARDAAGSSRHYLVRTGMAGPLQR